MTDEDVKPLHPQQFERYYFIVKTQKAADHIMKHGILATPEGMSESPEQKASQQKPYGAYGTQSGYELEAAKEKKHHIIETEIPTEWIQSNYGTDTYSAHDIPPSYIKRHIKPEKKKK